MNVFSTSTLFRLVSIFILCVFSVTTMAAKNQPVTSYIEEAEKYIKVQNFSRAYDLYQLAAELGNAEAQYQVYNLLNLGSDIEIDKRLSQSAAKDWLRKSAAQEHPAAMYQLALTMDHSMEEMEEESAGTLMARAAKLGFQAAKKYRERDERNSSVKKNSAIKSDFGLNTSTNIQLFDLWFGAARLGDLDTLKSLNRQGISLDQKNKVGRTALFVAIEFDQQEVLSWLLSQNGVEKVNINHVDHFGFTPLYIALSKNNEQFFSMLIDAKANLEHVFNNGDSIWHQLISLDKLSFSDLLFKHKADINNINQAGWTPLDLAYYHEHKALAQKMKSLGARHGNTWVIQKNTISNTTAEQYYRSRGSQPVDTLELSKVIASGNEKLFTKLIIDNPKLINKTFEDGTTLLMYASVEKQASIVETLLENGALPNASDEKGLTALHLASRYGYISIAKLLFKYKADPNKICKQGMDALDWAVKTKQGNTFIQLVHVFKNDLSRPLQRYLLAAAKNNMTGSVKLLAKNVEFDLADQLGRTSSWYAAYHKNIEMLDSLNKLVDKNKIDKYGKTALLVAIEKDCFTCAKKLANIENIHIQSQSGDTPLIIAAANGNTEIVEWLLNKDVEVDARNSLGNTALITATESQNLAVVQHLVESKASISRKNQLGFSALDIAERKNKEIFDYLKSHSILGVL